MISYVFTHISCFHSVMDKLAGLSEAKGEVTTFENVVLPKILTIAGSDSGAFIVYDVISILI